MNSKLILLVFGAILILCILLPQYLGIFGWILALPAAAGTNLVIDKVFPKFPTGVATTIVFWLIYTMLALSIAHNNGYRHEDTLMQDQRGYY
jgi:hypothetical protein